MKHRYAVYSKNGELSFNCISHLHNSSTKLGDIINGAEVVYVGSLDECEAMVKAKFIKF